MSTAGFNFSVNGTVETVQAGQQVLAQQHNLGYAEGFNAGFMDAVGKFHSIVFALLGIMLLQVFVSRIIKMNGIPGFVDADRLLFSYQYPFGGERVYRVKDLLYSIENIAFTAQFMLISFLFVVGMGVEPVMVEG
jgi:hypothetical protein